MSWLRDPKVWRTLFVNVAAAAPAVAGFVPPVYGTLIMAIANLINHAYNSQTASAS